MFGTKSKSIAGAIIISLIIQLISPIVSVHADNTIYYVDATAGSDGNDGLDQGTPWKTLSHVSTQTFLPGDQILLKCGERWDDTLIIDDVGTVGSPITISKYGSCDSTSVVTLENTGAEQIYIAPGSEYITISDITFSGGSGIILDNASYVEILQNRFHDVHGVGITNSGSIYSTIQQNFLSMASGSIGIVNINDSLSTVSQNTFSGGSLAITVENSVDTTISSNTIFNPSTYAITVEETPDVPAGTMQNNIIAGNTLLTWNIDYPMIRSNDMNDDIGTLANFSGNRYINVYKATLPIIEVETNGGGTTTYNKSDITTLDPSASIFTEFGYKNWISTGVLNPRTNEARLLVNTGSSAANMACPGGGGCPTQYVALSTPDANITFPRSVGAYSSEIILWRDTNSYLTPMNILHKPTGEFNPSDSTPPIGTPIDLTWSISSTGTNISSIIIEGDTSTGTFSISVGSSGSLSIYPPEVGNANYTLYATNDIGTMVKTKEVVPVNSPPVALGGTSTGTEDIPPISGQVLAVDPNGTGTLAYSLEVGVDPAHGSVGLDPDGTFNYYSALNFCGQTQFQYIARDEENAASEPGIYILDVLCTNDAPIALDDTLSATGGITGILDVTANDQDPDSPYETQIFTVSGITLPTQGALIASGSVFEYTPDIAFVGTDSFIYVTIDQSGAVSNTGTAIINVAPGMNIAPEVFSGSHTITEDSTLNTSFSGGDLNGDILSFSAVTLPSHGTVNIMGTTFEYTPDANYNGTDSFDFIGHDGTVGSNIGTISIAITSVADMPTAVDDTINVEMNNTTNLDIMVNDYDSDDPYPVQTLSLESIVSAPSFGTAAIIGNQVRYTPDLYYTGSDSFTYTISDQNTNISNTATVTINITTSNHLPTAEDASFTLNEDIPLTATLSGSDIDLTPVTFVLDIPASHGTVVLSSTGEFTYTPNANYYGTDSFTFHVSDGVFSSTTNTVHITINSENDNPIAVPDTFSTNEDTAIILSPLTNDYDSDTGDVFTLQSVTAAINGSAVMSGSNILYTPNTDYCGTDSFEYTTIDLSGATSNAGTVSMTVTCVNDAPLVYPGSYTLTGNILTSSGNSLIGTFSGTDIDIGDTLTYTIVNSPLSGALSFSGGNTFTYTPDIDFIGTDTLSFYVTDSGGLISSTENILIAVLPNDYNTPPLAYSGAFSTNEDTPLNATLSGYDIEGAALTYILDTTTSSGVLSLSTTGVITYTPNVNYHGTDNFSFHVSDGENISATTMVSITIASINDTPVIINDTLTVAEDSSGNINPTLNDTDADGDTMSLNTYTTSTHGLVTATGNTINYTPNNNYCGSDIINYTITDTHSAVSATGAINITITCTNDAPTASGETLSGIEDTAIFIPVLGNDTDPENTVLSVANLTQPSTGGTVQLVGTGVRFTPTPNFCMANPITFTYQARDTANILSNIATVTVTSITCINDAPTSLSASYTMTGNVVINPGTVLSGGTLTGYTATNNNITQNLTAMDVDGDAITFGIVTPPTHGTGTLSVTGVISYTPTPGFIGNDFLTFTVSDGVTSSSTYTLTFAILDPNPVVEKMVVTTAKSGPSGGGGGYGAVVIAGITKSQKTSTGGLTSQLLLADPKMRQMRAYSGNITNISTKEARIDNFLLPIKEAVEETTHSTTSSKERALKIRQSGQKLIQSITQSIILESVEQAVVLEEAESQISQMQTKVTLSRESRALEFIIRLMKRERAKIEKGVETVQYLMSI